MTEYQVVPAGKGGKVKVSFPSGLEVVCRKRTYPILLEKEEHKSSVFIIFKRIDKDFEIDDIESLVVSDNYLEILKSRRKK